MRNYAKYCKIQLDNKKYQLNLTETGKNQGNFLNRFLAVNGWASLLYIIFKLGQNFYFKSLGLLLDPELITKIATACLFLFTFCLPITKFGKAYNAMLRNIILKRKTKKYYKKMRALEYTKSHKNFKKHNKKQIRITKKFAKYLHRVTVFNSFVSRKFQRKINKKGFVDGLSGFAYESIESVQESIDKFIFHNKLLLIKACPKLKEFFDVRSQFHASNIAYDNGYYDEYILAAKNTKGVKIKNNCINEFEEITYFEELRQKFGLQSQEKIPTPISFDTAKSKNLEKINNINNANNKNNINAKNIYMEEELTI